MRHHSMKYLLMLLVLQIAFVVLFLTFQVPFMYGEQLHLSKGIMLLLRNILSCLVPLSMPVSFLLLIESLRMMHRMLRK